MTNCGELGWVSERRGYRYDPVDPASGARWPAMPDSFRALAREAAARAGYPGFAPDACLLNRYAPGARLSLHQDRDEKDLRAPIVSVSLGLPAVFLWGGDERGGRTPRWRSTMATSRCGAARRACASTACSRCATASIRSPAVIASTSPSARSGPEAAVVGGDVKTPGLHTDGASRPRR
jgi:DNA alkylation damage repair protein AlkB